MKELLEKAIAGAKEAGAEMLRHYATTDFETKTDGTPVTVADIRSNEILLEHLAKTGIPVLSEETAGISLPESAGIPLARPMGDVGSARTMFSPHPLRMWIIDPLDGTKDFIKKNGDFSVMIGLLEEGRPVLGVVYAPVHNTLYYATKDDGAYLEKDGETRKLAASTRSKEGLRCIRSINHFTSRMETVVQKLSATMHPHGSIGIKAGLLAEGEGDFFFSWGNFGEWDVCAPEIIVREAGGSVTDTTGKELSYGTRDHRVEHGIVFSNTACHEHILEAIRTTPPQAA